MSVNNWVKRFKLEGIDGLSTKPGQGRKPTIDKVEDRAGILKAIKAHRQRLQTAKAQWEAESGKSVSIAIRIFRAKKFPNRKKKKCMYHYN